MRKIHCTADCSCLLHHNGKSIVINALLDDGSTKTYLNSDIAAELGLISETQHITVSMLNGHHENFRTSSVTVDLCSLNGRICAAFTTDNVTGSLEVVSWQKFKNNCNHLHGINFPKIEAYSKIDMLIGLDYTDLHFACQDVCGRPGGPIARLTPLGWTCIGVPKPGVQPLQTNFAHTYFCCDNAITELAQELRKFWEVEEIISEKYVMSSVDRSLM